MEQTFWEKLKRVKLSDLGSVFLFLFAIPVALLYRKKNRDLWLICDWPCEARDNGFFFFHYLCSNRLQKTLVFAIDRKSPDYNKVKNLGKTVSYGSFSHWVYYLSSHVNISSQKAGNPNAAICYFLNKWRLITTKQVFLQHGIIKDDIPYLYYKNTNIQLFTCSTEREFNFVKDNFGYPASNVQLLGLCRFDYLWNAKVQKSQILIMPTWRKWLSHPSRDISKTNLEARFLASDFYSYWKQLISDGSFVEFLKKTNMQAKFYLHRELQQYTHFFKSQHSCIEVMKFPEADLHELIKNSSLFITDYSSVAMDFAYMGKPVIYYQFDQSDFRNRHLLEGYFSYKTDGFGPICNTSEDLVKELKIMTSDDWPDHSEYSKRRKDFFTLLDKENCRRTYEAIKSL